MTDELIAFLKRQEGLRLKPYLDQVGNPTIGYGHLLASLDVPPITEARAEQMLREDATHAEDEALLFCPFLDKYPRRLAALTDLVFNVGAHKLKGTGTVRALNLQDWKAAAAKFRLWDKATDRKTGALVPVAALTKRRAEAAVWIEEG